MLEQVVKPLSSGSIFPWLTADRIVTTNSASALETPSSISSDQSLTLSGTATATVAGLVTAQSGLSVSSNATVSGTATVTGLLTASSALTVNSTATFLGIATVIDANFSIVGSSDSTKTMRFEVDAQTAGDTLTINTGAQTDSRTLTAPVLTGNATLAVLSETQTFDGTKTFSAVTTVSNATASTTTTNGALVVAGGVGVGGRMNVGSVISSDFISALGSSATAIISAGGDAIAADKTFDFNTAAGNNRLFRWLSGGVARWGIGANSSAESGANAGSRLVVRAFSDAGASLGDIITMFRAAGGSILIARPISNSDTIVSTSPTAGVGYAAGAGGTVAQGSGSGKATTVTLNAVCGTITMDGANLNADTTVAFTFTNSAIANTDLVVIQHSSVGTLGGYNFAVTPGSGTATVSVRNVTPGNLAEAIVLRFAIIKAVTS